MEKTTRPPEGGQAAATYSIDINSLTDAYLADNYEPLAPFITLEERSGQVYSYLRQDIWNAIWDEIARREAREENARHDHRARLLGYRDAPAASRAMLTLLEAGHPIEAFRIYREVYQ